MDESGNLTFAGRMGEEDWWILDTFLERLTEKVRLVVWGDIEAGCLEEHAADLCAALAERYEAIEVELRPAQGDHPYHPIIGVMGVDGNGGEIDFQVRLVGLPDGLHINTLVGVIQAVSFRGQTLEPLTRIHLSRLQKPAALQVFTTANDEGGVLMGTLVANLAVVNERVRAQVFFLQHFPALVVQKSIYNVPHIILNDRHHLEGVVDEEKMLAFMARVLKNG